MSYKFISPIKANRDAMAAKLAAKGGTNVSSTATVTVIKDKDGKPVQVADKGAVTPSGDQTSEDQDMFIVESDVMP